MYVTIMDNCIGCGACEAINSEVFYLTKKANVNNKKTAKHIDDCVDAAIICPVNAILIMEKRCSQASKIE